VVNKGMVTPLHSPPGLDSAYLGFPFWAMADVLTCLLNLNLITVKLCTLSCIDIGIVVCLRIPF